ncbi:hypothetical protein ACJJTC_009701 [Scirpophaga incertulas]
MAPSAGYTVLPGRAGGEPSGAWRRQWSSLGRMWRAVTGRSAAPHAGAHAASSARADRSAGCHAPSAAASRARIAGYVLPASAPPAHAHTHAHCTSTPRLRTRTHTLTVRVRRACARAHTRSLYEYAAPAHAHTHAHCTSTPRLRTRTHTLTVRVRRACARAHTRSLYEYAAPAHAHTHAHCTSTPRLRTRTHTLTVRVRRACARAHTRSLYEYAAPAHAHTHAHCTSTPRLRTRTHTLTVRVRRACARAHTRSLYEYAAPAHAHTHAHCTSTPRLRTRTHTLTVRVRRACARAHTRSLYEYAAPAHAHTHAHCTSTPRLRTRTYTSSLHARTPDVLPPAPVQCNLTFLRVALLSVIKNEKASIVPLLPGPSNSTSHSFISCGAAAARRQRQALDVYRPGRARAGSSGAAAARRQRQALETCTGQVVPGQDPAAQRLRVVRGKHWRRVPARSCQGRIQWCSGCASSEASIGDVYRPGRARAGSSGAAAARRQRQALETCTGQVVPGQDPAAQRLRVVRGKHWRRVPARSRQGRIQRRSGCASSEASIRRVPARSRQGRIQRRSGCASSEASIGDVYRPGPARAGSSGAAAARRQRQALETCTGQVPPGQDPAAQRLRVVRGKHWRRVPARSRQGRIQRRSGCASSEASIGDVYRPGPARAGSSGAAAARRQRQALETCTGQVPPGQDPAAQRLRVVRGKHWRRVPARSRQGRIQRRSGCASSEASIGDVYRPGPARAGSSGAAAARRQRQALETCTGQVVPGQDPAAQRLRVVRGKHWRRVPARSCQGRIQRRSGCASSEASIGDVYRPGPARAGSSGAAAARRQRQALDEYRPGRARAGSSGAAAARRQRQALDEYRPGRARAGSSGAAAARRQRQALETRTGQVVPGQDPAAQRLRVVRGKHWRRVPARSCQGRIQRRSGCASSEASIGDAYRPGRARAGSSGAAAARRQRQALETRTGQVVPGQDPAAQRLRVVRGKHWRRVPARSCQGRIQRRSGCASSEASIGDAYRPGRARAGSSGAAAARRQRQALETRTGQVVPGQDPAAQRLRVVRGKHWRRVPARSCQGRIQRRSGCASSEASIRRVPARSCQGRIQWCSGCVSTVGSQARTASSRRGTTKRAAALAATQAGLAPASVHAVRQRSMGSGTRGFHDLTTPLTI